MCSWGSNNKIDKFYKGAQADTPWNKDLLWRYHVTKEHKQDKVNAGEYLPTDGAIKLRRERMKMGIAGTLIPDMTPRQNPLNTERAMLRSSSSQRLMHHPSAEMDARGTSSQGGRLFKSSIPSSRASGSIRSSTSSSALSTSSSMRSIRLQDVQEILECQSRLLKEKTEDEMNSIRHALQEEARKRQEAEQKIQFLCEKLGIEG